MGEMYIYIIIIIYCDEKRIRGWRRKRTEDVKTMKRWVMKCDDVGEVDDVVIIIGNEEPMSEASRW